MNAELFSLMQEYLDKIRNTNVPIKTLGGELNFNPFFGLIHVSMLKDTEFKVVNGGTYVKSVPKNHTIDGRIEVRMGDYEKGSAAENVLYLPYILKKDVAEVILKRSINEIIWDSIDDYIARLDIGLGTSNSDDRFLGFSEEEPVRYLNPRHSPKIDTKDIQYNLEEVTGILKKKGITSCSAEFCLNESQKYLANTEGTLIYNKDRRWRLALIVRTTDSMNRILEHSHSFKGMNSNSFPTLETLIREGEKLVEEINEVKSAEIEKNGAYPTIMDPINHGVLWHEVVGHSLEGHRQQDGEWGDASNLFADRMDEVVAPRFITLVDDPTITELSGHYLYDEEGVPGQKVVLIDKGVLKNFLHSRESAAYLGVKSNGHARAENSEQPVSRMSNLIVESSRQVSYDELKDRLIRECKRQKKRYGLIMQEAEGGLTMPSDSMFNTYPTNVFRLYTDGKMERVRGIYIVGTPAQALNNMIATSDRYGTFDGYCGAESGNIPTTIKAPDLLLNSVEVNRIPNSNYITLRDPVLPD